MASVDDDNGNKIEPADGGELEHSASGAGWLDTLQHFDWLKIPGAVRALARLVAGSTEAAEAWIDILKAKGEQKAQAIRDVTEARSKTTRALTKAVSREAIADPGLLDRATHHLVLQELQKQTNREAVARETVNLLEKPPAGAAEPDVDWLNVFTAYAEKASSERMQKHWASVLAGEIRQPGSFSLTTLQLLSVVDGELAQIISETVGWVVAREFIPLLGKLSKGENYTKLMKLDAIGFLKLDSTTFISPVVGGTLQMANKQIKFITAGPEVSIGCGVLTIAGKQVLKLVAPAPVDPDVLEAFVAWLKSKGNSIEISDAE